MEKRVSQAALLLSHVDETGSEEADEHVERAREVVDEVLSEVR
ncbi:hypothetical protein [Haladaptatus sp. R4]|nr:hypothetical protein [Haladaptatus sp. R4]